MLDPTAWVAAVSLVVWLYLILFRGGFWRADRKLDPAPPPEVWPPVAVVVPARNEATVIGRTLTALLRQDYPGPFEVIVVDDRSDDGTAAAARRVAAIAAGRLTIVAGEPLPQGWTGKPWALAQGIAGARLADARYLWFSDADIEHDADTLRRLVAKAEAEEIDLVSLMAALHCRAFWERLLIPAFVFFFQKLYPFAWVNDPRRRTAAAAGGCMLVREAALAAAGGLRTIADALIDDCALAAVLKARGRIWLGLATTTRSIRPYSGLADIWDMVARSAFTQLRHSTALLAATLAGMALIYLAPPFAVVAGALADDGAALALGGAAWTAMALTYAPTLRLYGQPLAAAPLLPLAALLYSLMTADSALRHWRGQGGRWKGRSYGSGRDRDKGDPDSRMDPP